MVGNSLQQGHLIGCLLDCLTSFELDDTFNPWVHNCARSDTESSSQIRLGNLRSVLDACIQAEEVDLWIGRDLGWRGGRRTGVPFVDEIALSSYASSVDARDVNKATIDQPMKERTATEVHSARVRVDRKIFFWNVFPFHPYEKGNPLTNRMHTRKEREIGAKILLLVLHVIDPKKVVAVGNDATTALVEIGIECCSVRHPSYGGQREFHSQINMHYGISGPVDPQLLLI